MALLPFKNPRKKATLYFGEFSNTYVCGQASNALPIIQRPSVRTAPLIYCQLFFEIFRITAFVGIWEQSPHGICNHIEHAISSSNHS
jgi:hypothetical protein